MQSQEIARQIEVSSAETAKILQLLVWGSFVTSKRGSKGGFHLAADADQITMGQVIDFFLSRHPQETDDRFTVMRIFEETTAPCQKAFGRLTLRDIATQGTKPGRTHTKKAGVK